LALGYLLGKASSRLLKTKLNVPLALTLSVIPDIDILIPFLEHRGPTHSLITLMLILPFSLAVFGKNSLPYFVALAQHALVGDFITSRGIKMFWPMTNNWYGLGIDMLSLTNLTLELTSFVLSMTVLLVTRDIIPLLKPHKSNFLLLVPSGAIMSTLIGFTRESPPLLIIPHYIYIALFAVSILIDLGDIFQETPHRRL